MMQFEKSICGGYI